MAERGVICEYFLHEILVFCRTTKVFSLECFPLYGITSRSRQVTTLSLQRVCFIVGTGLGELVSKGMLSQLEPNYAHRALLSKCRAFGKKLVIYNNHLQQPPPMLLTIKCPVVVCETARISPQFLSLSATTLSYFFGPATTLSYLHCTHYAIPHIA